MNRYLNKLKSFFRRKTTGNEDSLTTEPVLTVLDVPATSNTQHKAILTQETQTPTLHDIDSHNSLRTPIDILTRRVSAKLSCSLGSGFEMSTGFVGSILSYDADVYPTDNSISSGETESFHRSLARIRPPTPLDSDRKKYSPPPSMADSDERRPMRTLSMKKVGMSSTLVDSYMKSSTLVDLTPPSFIKRGTLLDATLSRSASQRPPLGRHQPRSTGVETTLHHSKSLAFGDSTLQRSSHTKNSRDRLHRSKSVKFTAAPSIERNKEINMSNGGSLSGSLSRPKKVGLSRSKSVHNSVRNTSYSGSDDEENRPLGLYLRSKGHLVQI